MARWTTERMAEELTPDGAEAVQTFLGMVITFADIMGPGAWTRRRRSCSIPSACWHVQESWREGCCGTSGRTGCTSHAAGLPRPPTLLRPDSDRCPRRSARAQPGRWTASRSRTINPGHPAARCLGDAGVSACPGRAPAAIPTPTSPRRSGVSPRQGRDGVRAAGQRSGEAL